MYVSGQASALSISLPPQPFRATKSVSHIFDDANIGRLRGDAQATGGDWKASIQGGRPRGGSRSVRLPSYGMSKEDRRASNRSLPAALRRFGCTQSEEN